MIVRLLGKLNARLRAGWLYRSVDEALSLNRTEVRPDGLRPEDISLRLAISWRARNLHPWDRDLVGDRRALRLVEQTFSDTEAALERLFVLLPEIDVIDLRVFGGGRQKRRTLDERFDYAAGIRDVEPVFHCDEAEASWAEF